MAKVQVKKLAQYGIVSDVEPYELPSNAWSGGNNISFQDGGVVRIQGMLPFLKETEEEVMAIYTKDNYLYYTTAKGIYLFTGRDHIKLNKDGENFTPSSDWTVTELSNILVFSSDTIIPKYLPLNKLEVEDLPEWQKGWRSNNVRAYKNFLIALGTHENGINYPQRVRWSDVTMPNSPPLDWDATSTTNSAGFNELSNTRGKILDGLELNDHFYLYTEEDVHLMEYIAGNDIFRFRKVLENVGILAKGCVCKVDGGHFVVTRKDVGVHNGNSFKSVVEGSIKEKLFDEIRNSSDYNDVKVVAYPAKAEIWVTYKTAGAEYYNKAAIFNTSSGVWTFRELPEMTAIHYGVVPRDATGFIDDQDMLIDDNDEFINDVGKDFTRAGLFMSVRDGGWIAVDEGYAVPHRKNIRCYVERLYLDFDDVGLNPDDLKQVLSVYPQATGSGQMNIYIGVSDSPYRLPTWSRPVRFDLKTGVKADFRMTGRYISVRFETMDNQEWKLLGYGIDVDKRGGR